MNHRTGTFFTVALGAALLTIPPGLAAATAPTNTNSAAKPVDKVAELFGDAVVAKGKGVEVKRSQLDATMISYTSTLAARGQGIPPGTRSALERQMLESLIQIQLLLNKATEADKAKGKEDFDKRYAAITNRAGSEENLNRQLIAIGMTKDEFRSKINEEATASVVVERELKVNITDEAAKKYYDENPTKFEQPELVHANHILLLAQDPATGAPLADAQKAAKRKQIEDILKRARAGEDFAKLAREFSEDAGSKEKGGEIRFPRMQTGLPEFEAVAFSLNTNQISDVVTTPVGYHIIKLIEKIPARKIPLAEVADTLKESLKQQELQKQLPDFIAKLKKDAGVEILDEKLKAIEVPEPAPAAPAKPAEKK